MGLMSNTVSICQFQATEGELPPIEDRYEWLRDRLLRQRFIDIKDSPDEVSLGIVELHDNAKTDFDDPGAFWIGTYFGFTIRQDTRRIPPAILQEETQKQLTEWLQEHPDYTRVPKAARQDIKEAVRAHLMTKTLPAPSTFDVAWNTVTGIVTIGTTSNKGIDTVTTILAKAFPEFRFQMVHPYARAAKVAEKAGLTTNLQDRNQSRTESIAESIQANKWIGTDLLLWMLYARECQTTELPFWIDNKIVLQQSDDDGEHTISIKGVQSRLGEVKAALRDGKQITQATVYMTDETEETWRMTLKADTFYFASYKCPTVQIERDDTTDLHDERQAVFLERMHLMEKGMGLFERILATFLETRLKAESWGAVTQKISEWIKE